MRIAPLLLSAMLVASAGPGLAHEFWISPETYTIDPGDQLRADLRVGQRFEGASYSFIPPRFDRFDLVQGESTVPVAGRMGDSPALQMEAPGEGLVVVVHETTDSTLTYDEWQKFVDFVTHKDFDGVLEAHAARGLPETGFRERYSRYAKSLIAVGAGAGSDREVGLLTEIVAEANPYTDDVAGGLPVRVLYEGEPRAGVQVEVFARATDGTVEVTTTRTDADGRATIPVSPGVEYLVDSVVMRPLEPGRERDPVWESLWASLTFRVPG